MKEKPSEDTERQEKKVNLKLEREVSGEGSPPDTPTLEVWLSNCGKTYSCD